MPVEFWNSETEELHADFQEWRTRHSDGHFVNVTSPTAVMLHHVTCHHFEGTGWRQDDDNAMGSLTKRRKVCSVDVDALRRWAKEHAPSATLKNCDCVKGRVTNLNAR